MKLYTITIDKIIRVSRTEYLIIYLERSPVRVTVSAPGNAQHLLDWLLEAPYGAA